MLSISGVGDGGARLAVSFSNKDDEKFLSLAKADATSKLSELKKKEQTFEKMKLRAQLKNLHLPSVRTSSYIWKEYCSSGICSAVFDRI